MARKGKDGPQKVGAMVRICVVGGKLQGLEATYLAKKAGFTTILIDRRKAPASYLADETYLADVLRDDNIVRAIIKSSDAVLPALEDLEALLKLERVCKELGIPYMQDTTAFTVTSNKRVFAKFCYENQIPHPKLFPQATFPVIVKPVIGSGGKEVHFVESPEKMRQVQEHMRKKGVDFIVQEYATGYFLSLELLGLEGLPMPMQVTCLEFDEGYGCKRVLAPWPYGNEVIKKTIAIGEKVVKGLRLTGLTDIQVVVREGGHVEIIEANARLPSQTPTVVYHSTDVNMVELLLDLFLKGRLPSYRPRDERVVIYQHILIKDGRLKVVAERELSRAMGLRIERGFYGLDEAITNLSNNEGVATLIVKDANYKRAKERMKEALKSIATDFRASTIEDASPWGVKSLYDEIDS